MITTNIIAVNGKIRALKSQMRHFHAILQHVKKPTVF